jgi:hypothetical protein
MLIRDEEALPVTDPLFGFKWAHEQSIHTPAQRLTRWTRPE